MPLSGLDIGSTGAKITVLSESGALLHTGYRDYPVSRATSEHEVDAVSIWDAVKALLRDAATAVPGISAVGVTSFGESFVLLDEQDHVLCPTMMYTDPRGEAEAALLSQRLGERLSEICGATPHAMYSLPKLMWIKEHQPELYVKARRVCLIADYVSLRLTGNHLIDHSLAARTLGFDIRKMCWSEAIFTAAGLDPGLFGKPVPTGTDAGPVLPALAQELDLPKNLRVVLCCHDQVAAAVGSGVLMPGMATDGAGTVQCITPIFSPVPDGRGLQDHHYSIVPFLRKDTYCCYAFQFTGGSLVKWFVDNLARKQPGIAPYDQLESGMIDAPTGILVLPHFAGAATPYMDTGSKGAFVGLTLSHNASDLYRALLEGITYEMRLNLDCLGEAGLTVDGLFATGGCAKSKLWLQMKADILGMPVTRMSVDEAGTVGGIMLTGVATGAYKDLDAAKQALVRPVHVYKPRPEMVAQYAPHYLRYRELYRALRPLMEDIK